jgi:CubicO group peptidase (beta-lactamase class C family)
VATATTSLTGVAAELDSWLPALMEEKHVPGVAVGMLHDDEEATAAFGLTSVENPLPVTADTLFQIGSITKTFTATAVMMLVEKGELDLDAPVRSYLPDFTLSSDEISSRVTLRHLLTHVGGWVGDYFGDFGRGDDALAGIVASMPKAKQLTPLGEVFSYNNTAFDIAGRVIEKVTGQVYERVIRDMIFAPLGMEKSFFFAEELISYRVAIGHIWTDDGLKPARRYALSRAMNPAGGIVSCVSDMLRYARFQMGDGTAPDGSRLLRRETMDHMQSPLSPGGNFCDAVGVAWLLNDYRGYSTFGHGGSTNGFQADLTIAPDAGFALVVLTNGDHGSEVYRPIVDQTLEKVAGLKAPQREHQPRDEGTLTEYLGHYSAMLSEVDLTSEGGYLVLKSSPPERIKQVLDNMPAQPPPVRLAFYDEDRVIALDPPFKDSRGEFLRAADGSIQWFRWGGRIMQPRSIGANDG